ncbi:hypothetical protein Sjap_002551 [Stephania japonica]|uniref:Uncharacterized protein n=1 Tax=Stephania japonica TaxID=461633 RepID=A0AAP0KMA8_9MAGN
MARHSCSNTDTYSSPVPIIGLYIAGASLVCLLLILCDMLFGLRRRYIPCRLFSLNSVTLTLLGVASKLPVDLTTDMPSARDQLSKLTSTTMICICMGFMMPSLAISRGSESITNMVALSILVVTMIVNMCIQMATGVIFSFIVEHIIILCFSFLVLLVLWFSALETIRVKTTLKMKNRGIFTKGEESSLIHRVKRWYLHNVVIPYGLSATMICLLCSLVFLQAAFRSLFVLNKVSFCEGVSDYGWSMWMIVITQILTIVIGSIAIAIRWLTTATRLTNIGAGGNFMDLDYDDYTIQFLLMKRRSMKASVITLSRLSIKYGLSLIMIFVLVTITVVPLYVSLLMSFFVLKSKQRLGIKFLGRTSERSDTLDSWKAELGDVRFDYNKTWPDWIMKECVKDIEKWMKSKTDGFPSYAVRMLSKHPLPRQSNFLIKYQTIGQHHWKEYKLACLSMVLLVKFVLAAAPSSLTEPLRRTVDETFEIIYYIDRNINVGDIHDQRRRDVAKLLHEGGDLQTTNKKGTSMLHTNTSSVSNETSNIERSASEEIAFEELITIELKVIRDFINEGQHTSMEGLCDYIEQLFSEMLRFFLAQLPVSILKDVNEGPIEDSEERARFVAKFLCCLDPSLEDKVQWTFPEGTNITSFFDISHHQHHHDANVQHDTSTQEGGSSATAYQNAPTGTHDLEEICSI